MIDINNHKLGSVTQANTYQSIVTPMNRFDEQDELIDPSTPINTHRMGTCEDLILDKDKNANFFRYCGCAQILIVDDEPFNLIVLEGLLHQLGVKKIDKSHNGKEALQKLKLKAQSSICDNHQQYKLVITDNNMPFLTGTQLAKEFREA